MRRILPSLLLVPLGLGLAACGDDGAGAAGSGSHSASAAATADGAHAVPDGVAAQYATMEAEIAAEGGETRSGDWRVAYIVEPAEPWHEHRAGRLSFREPATAETHHIEILPIEAATGRLVPAVPIRLQVVDAGGQVVDEKRLSFYHAEFFHYANNFSVPETGEYVLRATLGIPGMRHHGEADVRPALAHGVTVTFDDVRLEAEG